MINFKHENKDRKLEYNKKYCVTHENKGTFYIKVIDSGDTWVSGIVIPGPIITISKENTLGIYGRKILIDRTLCKFKKIEE